MPDRSALGRIRDVPSATPANADYRLPTLMQTTVIPPNPTVGQKTNTIDEYHHPHARTRGCARRAVALVIVAAFGGSRLLDR